MMQFLLQIQSWLLPLIIIVAGIKVLVFVAYNQPQWNYKHFIYFRSKKIIASENFQKVTVKIIQNCLSYYLLFLIILHLLVKVLV
jgi:hypothetical protein